MIKIIHTADTHLGYKQYQNETRREDFFKSFDSVINDSIRFGVNAIIHSGDLFDSRIPSLDDIIKTISILQKLKKNNIYFLSIVGNHEIKQTNQWLDLLEEMNLTIRLRSVPFIIKSENIDIYVYGIDNMSSYKYKNYDFNQLYFKNNEESNNKKYFILAMHQLFYPFTQSKDFSCKHILEKFNIDFDLLLLGDYHENEMKNIKYLSKTTKKYKLCYATYSGSTERCSISEINPRYYNMITITKESILITKKKINTRNFCYIKIYCNKDETFEDINNNIIRTIDKYEKKIINSVVFLELIGENNILLNQNDIEQNILKKSAILTRIIDRRNIQQKNIPKDILLFQNIEQKIDETLSSIKLNDYSIFIDQLVRKTSIPKSKLPDEIEIKIKEKLNNNTISLQNNYNNNISDFNTKKNNLVKRYTLDNQLN